MEPWVYWDDAFTEEELEKIVSYCETFELEYGTILESEDKETVEKHRVSDVLFHERNADTAWIFDRLNFVIQAINEKFYNFDLNGYSKFQYTTYNSEKNGRYEWHMDTSMGRQKFEDIEMRKLSLSLLLNDSFKGGEFCVNLGSEQNCDIVPMKKGRIVLFPSFMNHQVRPVTLGIRRSLVVWVLGPKFK
jgi:PKHD-type hydroxylase